ncbi:hypothetical protein CES85_4530 [Ochrobactrum quorumnocens]|uniref:Uncharacterized protein n=1 Tax=Ochrobactrum quorumnocens TaxID=271865 RepID=A0A248UAC8_9HYPH|nr:hypothetical protein [[Ochrobactrum] quorumnocens]ASV83747.1 hypothetical protein CES85_4530 [[Ochrobactrum] quorumnocens]
MFELPSSGRFVPSYPLPNNPISQTKFGGPVISTVEFVDPYRTVDVEALPMKASEAVQLEAGRVHVGNRNAHGSHKSL